jgi:putative ABC transport system permease protein
VFTRTACGADVARLRITAILTYQVCDIDIARASTKGPTKPVAKSSNENMNRIAADFRFAFRSLLRAPAFTLIVVMTLALGIGANTAMFGVAESVLWRPMPYANPGRLVQVWETNPLKRWTDAPVAPANFADWQKRNTVFDELAAYTSADMKGASGFDVFLSGAGEPQRLKAVAATGNLFRVLGVNPQLGRTFRDEETFAGKNAVTILSWELWQSAFGGDPNIVAGPFSSTLATGKWWV